MPRFSISAALLLLSCAAVEARVIAVNPQQMQRLGIRTDAVRPADNEPAVSVLGRVTPAPDARVPVSAPFAGSIRSLIRLEGETVKKGDALATIASADMHAALGRLKGLEAQHRRSKAAADRARILVAEGIAPASRAEEAEAEAASAAADLVAARTATARAASAKDGTYRLLAPEAGRIASVEVEIGAQVAAMQPLMTIDTREEFWIEAALPAQAVGRVSPGDQVRVQGAADAVGTVVAVGATIDPRTRAATLRARMAALGPLIGGQTVRLTILRRAASGSLKVPRAAIVELKGGPAVFVARGGGFEPVSVGVTAEGPAEATVKGRLTVKDRVAVAGLSELKAASLQE